MPLLKLGLTLLPRSGEGTYVVTNEAAKNAWGNSRGYVIHPGPLCRLTNLRSKRTENNVNWAKQHLAVSVRKEEEPSSSSPWNINLPGRAPVDFYKVNGNNDVASSGQVRGGTGEGSRRVSRVACRVLADRAQFFNNESISQEDLVVWLNLGTHHIPRAEDSPNTLTNMATSYVLLSPWNYNDYDVAME
jgi:primary-amine oxidase